MYTRVIDRSQAGTGRPISLINNLIYLSVEKPEPGPAKKKAKKRTFQETKLESTGRNRSVQKERVLGEQGGRKGG